MKGHHMLMIPTTQSHERIATSTQHEALKLVATLLHK